MLGILWSLIDLGNYKDYKGPEIIMQNGMQNAHEELKTFK